jgi:energy-coupling factor transporter ATP-binding protein EcfA2
VPNQNWFPDDRVAVNPGLVAIIGPRGSGKTALADVIAAGAGSDEPFSNPRSFLSRARRLLRGSVSEVHWTHGPCTRRDLSDADTSDPLQPSGVRYLSQQFVEQMCAADGLSDNLLAEVERVVFDSLELGQRQGATDFRELLDIRLQAARARQADESKAIADLSSRIANERILERSRSQ